jgi:hypothetical protein
MVNQYGNELVNKKGSEKLRQDTASGTIVNVQKDLQEVVYENEGRKMSNRQAKELRYNQQQEQLKHQKELAKNTLKTVADLDQQSMRFDAMNAIDGVLGDEEASPRKRVYAKEYARAMLRMKGIGSYANEAAALQAYENEILNMSGNELMNKRAEVADELLIKQAWRAHRTGTKKHLLSIYEDIKNMSAEEAEAAGLSEDYIREADKAIDVINESERVYNEYSNKYDPFMAEMLFENRELHRKKEEELAEVQAAMAEYEKQFELDFDPADPNLTNEQKEKLAKKKQIDTMKAVQDEFDEKNKRLQEELEELNKQVAAIDLDSLKVGDPQTDAQLANEVLNKQKKLMDQIGIPAEGARVRAYREMRRRGVTPEFFRDAEKDYNSLVRRRDAIRNRLRVSNQSFVRMRDLSKRVADKKSEMYNDMKARIAAFRHLADLIKLQNDGLATMFLDLSENMSDIDNTIESDMMILMTQGMKKSDAKSMLKDIIQTRLQVKFPKKTKAEIEKAIEKYQELIDKMSGDTIDLNFIKVKNQLSSISGIVVFNQNANKYEMILDVPGVLYFDQTDPAQKKTGEELLKLTNVAGQPIFLETGENTDPNSGVTIKRIEAINSPRVDVSADLLYHVKAIPNDNATVPSSKFKWNSARNGSVFNAITTNNRTNQVINNLQRQLQIARRRLRVYNKKKTMLQRAKTAIQPNTLQGILDRAFASVGITLTPEDIENIITQGIKPDGTINQSYIRRLFRIGSAKAKRVADIVFADMPNLTVYPDVEKSLLLEELKKQYDAMPTDLENQEAYETVRDEVEATDDLILQDYFDSWGLAMPVSYDKNTPESIQEAIDSITKEIDNLNTDIATGEDYVDTLLSKDVPENDEFKEDVSRIEQIKQDAENYQKLKDELQTLKDQVDKEVVEADEESVDFRKLNEQFDLARRIDEIEKTLASIRRVENYMQRVVDSANDTVHKLQAHVERDVEASLQRARTNIRSQQEERETQVPKPVETNPVVEEIEPEEENDKEELEEEGLMTAEDFIDEVVDIIHGLTTDDAMTDEMKDTYLQGMLERILFMRYMNDGRFSFDQDVILSYLLQLNNDRSAYENLVNNLPNKMMDYLIEAGKKPNAFIEDIIEEITDQLPQYNSSLKVNALAASIAASSALHVEEATNQEEGVRMPNKAYLMIDGKVVHANTKAVVEDDNIFLVATITDGASTRTEKLSEADAREAIRMGLESILMNDSITSTKEFFKSSQKPPMDVTDVARDVVDAYIDSERLGLSNPDGYTMDDQLESLERLATAVEHHREITDDKREESGAKDILTTGVKNLMSGRGKQISWDSIDNTEEFINAVADAIDNTLNDLVSTMGELNPEQQKLFDSITSKIYQIAEQEDSSEEGSIEEETPQEQEETPTTTQTPQIPPTTPPVTPPVTSSTTGKAGEGAGNLDTRYKATNRNKTVAAQVAYERVWEPNPKHPNGGRFMKGTTQGPNNMPVPLNNEEAQRFFLINNGLINDEYSFEDGTRLSKDRLGFELLLYNDESIADEPTIYNVDSSDARDHVIYWLSHDYFIKLKEDGKLYLNEQSVGRIKSYLETYKNNFSKRDMEIFNNISNLKEGDVLTKGLFGLMMKYKVVENKAVKGNERLTFNDNVTYSTALYGRLVDTKTGKPLFFNESRRKVSHESDKGKSLTVQLISPNASSYLDPQNLFAKYYSRQQPNAAKKYFKWQDLKRAKITEKIQQDNPGLDSKQLEAHVNVAMVDPAMIEDAEGNPMKNPLFESITFSINVNGEQRVFTMWDIMQKEDSAGTRSEQEFVNFMENAFFQDIQADIERRARLIQAAQAEGMVMSRVQSFTRGIPMAYASRQETQVNARNVVVVKPIFRDASDVLEQGEIVSMMIPENTGESIQFTDKDGRAVSTNKISSRPGVSHMLLSDGTILDEGVQYRRRKLNDSETDLILKLLEIENTIKSSRQDGAKAVVVSDIVDQDGNKVRLETETVTLASRQLNQSYKQTRSALSRIVWPYGRNGLIDDSKQITQVQITDNRGRKSYVEVTQLFEKDTNGNLTESAVNLQNQFRKNVTQNYYRNINRDALALSANDEDNNFYEIVDVKVAGNMVRLVTKRHEPSANAINGYMNFIQENGTFEFAIPSKQEARQAGFEYRMLNAHMQYSDTIEILKDGKFEEYDNQRPNILADTNETPRWMPSIENLGKNVIVEKDGIQYEGTLVDMSSNEEMGTIIIHNTDQVTGRKESIALVANADRPIRLVDSQDSATSNYIFPDGKKVTSASQIVNGNLEEAVTYPEAVVKLNESFTRFHGFPAITPFTFSVEMQLVNSEGKLEKVTADIPFNLNTDGNTLQQQFRIPIMVKGLAESNTIPGKSTMVNTDRRTLLLEFSQSISADEGLTRDSIIIAYNVLTRRAVGNVRPKMTHLTLEQLKEKARSYGEKVEAIINKYDDDALNYMLENVNKFTSFFDGYFQQSMNPDAKLSSPSNFYPWIFLEQGGEVEIGSEHIDFTASAPPAGSAMSQEQFDKIKGFVTSMNNSFKITGIKRNSTSKGGVRMKRVKRLSEKDLEKENRKLSGLSYTKAFEAALQGLKFTYVGFNDKQVDLNEYVDMLTQITNEFDNDPEAKAYLEVFKKLLGKNKIPLVINFSKGMEGVLATAINDPTGKAKLIKIDNVVASPDFDPKEALKLLTHELSHMLTMSDIAAYGNDSSGIWKADNPKKAQAIKNIIEDRNLALNKMLKEGYTDPNNVALGGKLVPSFYYYTLGKSLFTEENVEKTLEVIKEVEQAKGVTDKVALLKTKLQEAGIAQKAIDSAFNKPVEVVAGIFNDKAFKEFLSTIEKGSAVGNTKTNIFLDIIKAIVEILGKDIDGTVLASIIESTTALAEGVVIKPDQTIPVEEVKNKHEQKQQERDPNTETDDTSGGANSNNNNTIDPLNPYGDDDSIGMLPVMYKAVRPVIEDNLEYTGDDREQIIDDLVKLSNDKRLLYLSDAFRGLLRDDMVFNANYVPTFIKKGLGFSYDVLVTDFITTNEYDPEVNTDQQIADSISELLTSGDKVGFVKMLPDSVVSEMQSLFKLFPKTEINDRTLQPLSSLLKAVENETFISLDKKTDNMVSELNYKLGDMELSDGHKRTLFNGISSELFNVIFNDKDSMLSIISNLEGLEPLIEQYEVAIKRVVTRLVEKNKALEDDASQDNSKLIEITDQLIEKLTDEETVKQLIADHSTVELRQFGFNVKEDAIDAYQRGSEYTKFKDGMTFNTKDGAAPLIKMLIASLTKKQRVNTVSDDISSFRDGTTSIKLNEAQILQWQDTINKLKEQLKDETKEIDRARIIAKIARLNQQLETGILYNYSLDLNNDLGLSQLEDFSTVWNFLQKHLAEVPTDYSSIMSKIDELGNIENSKPNGIYSIATLSKNLNKLFGTLDDQLSLTTFTQFIQDFSKFEQEYFITLYGNEGNVYVVNANDENTIKILLKEWGSNHNEIVAAYNKANNIPGTNITEAYANDMLAILSSNEAKYNDAFSKFEAVMQMLGVTTGDDRRLFNALVRKYGSETALINYLTKIGNAKSEIANPKNPEDTIYDIPTSKAILTEIASVAVSDIITQVYENQYRNSKGEVVYSIGLNHFMSLAASKINNAAKKRTVNERREALRAATPHLFNPYTQNSKLFQGVISNGDKIRIGITSGINLDSPGSNGIETKDLVEPDLLSQRINNTLQGIYVIPQAADRGPTNVITVERKGQRFSLLYNDIDTAVSGFLGYLIDEINLIVSYKKAIAEGVEIEYWRDKDNPERSKGGKLRHFDGILSEEDKQKIEQLAEDIFLSENDPEYDGKPIQRFTDSFEFMEIAPDLAKSATLAIKQHFVEKTANVLREMKKHGLTHLSQAVKLGDETRESTFSVNIKAGDTSMSLAVPLGLDNKMFSQYAEAYLENNEVAAQNLTPISLSQKVLEKMVSDFVINQEAMYIEQSKMFFGDPAFFKSENDLFKRYAMFNSPKKIAANDEVTNRALNDNNIIGIVDADGNFTPLTANQHNALVNNQLELSEGQSIKIGIGYRSDFYGTNRRYDKFIKTAVINDPELVSPMAKDDVAEIFVQDGDIIYRDSNEEVTTPSTLTRIFAESFVKDGITNKDVLTAKTLSYVKPYKEMEEADGQGYISMDEYKTLLIKSGYDWKPKHQEIYVKIISGQEITPEEMFYFPPLKTQYTGPNNNFINPDSVNDSMFVPTGYKHSLLPLIPSMIKGSNLEKLAKRMRKEGVGIVQMSSGNKFGRTNSSMNNSFYKEGGQFNDDVFSTDALQPIDYDYFGVQLDVAPIMKGKVTVGTQPEKLFTANLFDNGTIKEEFSDLLDAVNLHDALKIERTQRLFNRFAEEIGVKADAEGRLRITSREKLLEAVIAEAKDRGVADNVYVSLEALGADIERTDGSVGAHVEEVLNSHKVENIIHAMVNARIFNQKRRGEAMVQASIAGFESGARRVEETTVLSNDVLSFYKEGRNILTGNEATVPAEVMIGLPKELVKVVSKVGGLDAFNRQIENLLEKVADYELNGNDDVSLTDDEKELLKAITLVGFRIPNQGPNSIESVRVKKFLPPEVGPLVIVPSEIVAKAGSDFDIDKLNIYIPTFRAMNKGGKVAVKYDSYVENIKELPYEEQARMFIKRVSDHVPSRIKGFDYVQQSQDEVRELKQNQQAEKDSLKLSQELMFEDYLTFKEKKEAFEREITKLVGKKVKKGNRNTYEKLDDKFVEGGAIFSDLPIALKEYYWEFNEQAKANGLSEIDKQLEFLSITNNLIVQFSSVYENIEKDDDSEGDFEISLTTKEGDVDNMPLIETLYRLQALKQNEEELIDMMADKEGLIEDIREMMPELNQSWTSLKDFENNFRERVTEQRRSILEARVKVAEEMAKDTQLEFETFNEFLETSPEVFNTNSAIENRMNEVMSEVFTHPANRRQIFAPIDDSVLIGEKNGVVWNIRFLTMADSIPGGREILNEYIADPTDDNFKNKKKKFVEAWKEYEESKSLTDSIDVLNNIVKHQAFLIGKKNIGIDARGITHHRLAQQAMVHLNQPIVITEDLGGVGFESIFLLPFKGKIIRERNGQKEALDVSFDELRASSDAYKKGNTSVLVPGDKVYISFGTVTDADGNYVLETLSAFLNAFVDVAKDPYVRDINTGADVVNVFLTLLRTGMSLNDVTMMMNQPVIKDYLERKRIFDSKFYKAAGFELSKKSIAVSVLRDTRDKIQGAAADPNTEERLPRLLSSSEFYSEELGLFTYNRENDTMKPTDKLTALATRFGAKINLMEDYKGYLRAYQNYVNQETGSNGYTYLPYIDANKLFNSDVSFDDSKDDTKVNNGLLQSHQFEISSIDSDRLRKNLHSPDYRTQFLILNMFMNAESISNKMTEFMEVTSQDTYGIPKNREALKNYNEKVGKVQMQDVNGRYPISGVNRIFENTFIKVFRDATFNIEHIYRELYLMDKLHYAAEEELSHLKKMLAVGKSATEKEKLNDNINEEFLTFVLHTDFGNGPFVDAQYVWDNLLYNNDQNNAYQYVVPNPDDTVTELGGSLLQFLNAIKRMDVDVLFDGRERLGRFTKKQIVALKNNSFIKEAIVKLAPVPYPYSEFESKTVLKGDGPNMLQIPARKLTTFRQNELSKAIKEIQQIDEKLYDDIFMLGLAQYGSVTTPNSYFTVLPAQDFLKLSIRQFDSLMELMEDHQRASDLARAFSNQLLRRRTDLLNKVPYDNRVYKGNELEGQSHLVSYVKDEKGALMTSIAPLKPVADSKKAKYRTYDIENPLPIVGYKHMFVGYKYSVNPDAGPTRLPEGDDTLPPDGDVAGSSSTSPEGGYKPGDIVSVDNVINPLSEAAGDTMSWADLFGITEGDSSNLVVIEKQEPIEEKTGDYITTFFEEDNWYVVESTANGFRATVQLSDNPSISEDNNLKPDPKYTDASRVDLTTVVRKPFSVLKDKPIQVRGNEFTYINTMRTAGDFNENFGNPFVARSINDSRLQHVGNGNDIMEDVAIAVQLYDEWLRKPDYDSTSELFKQKVPRNKYNELSGKRDKIRSRVSNSMITNYKFLYMDPFASYRGQYYSHADALYDLVKDIHENNITPWLSSDDSNELVSMTQITNHSGGAKGYDTQWHIIGKEFGMNKNKHYLLSTDGEIESPELKRLGVSKSKADLIVGPVAETGPARGVGQTEVTKAEQQMGRLNVNSVTRNKKKIRNYAQIASADSVFAVGSLIPKGAEITLSRGRVKKTALVPQVNGGTSVGVQLGINMSKPVYVFNQVENDTYPIGWYKWSAEDSDFVSTDTPILTKNFAGIGTSSSVTEQGKQAIRDVYQKTKDSLEGKSESSNYIDQDIAIRQLEAVMTMFYMSGGSDSQLKNASVGHLGDLKQAIKDLNSEISEGKIKSSTVEKLKDLESIFEMLADTEREKAEKATKKRLRRYKKMTIEQLTNEVISSPTIDTEIAEYFAKGGRISEANFINTNGDRNVISSDSYLHYLTKNQGDRMDDIADQMATNLGIEGSEGQIIERIADFVTQRISPKDILLDHIIGENEHNHDFDIGIIRLSPQEIEEIALAMPVYTPVDINDAKEELENKCNG